MKVSIENTQTKDGYSVSVEAPSDDLNITEVARMVRAALVAFGFHGETVDKILQAD